MVLKKEGEGKYGHILRGPQELRSDPDPLLLQLNNIQYVWNTGCFKQGSLRSTSAQLNLTCPENEHRSIQCTV